MPLYKVRTVDRYRIIRDVFVTAADPAKAKEKAEVHDGRSKELRTVTKLREARPGEEAAASTSAADRARMTELGIKPVRDDLPEVRLVRPRFMHPMGLARAVRSLAA